MRALTWGLLSLAWLTACGGRTPTKAEEPMDAGTEIEPDAGPTEQRESDKLDVLLVVDNSRTASMAHPALARTVPYLLDRILSPPCVNGLGQIVDTPPADTPCERGIRDFAPVRDVHIGVISSSLGAYGADGICTTDPQEDDRGWLLTRDDVGGSVSTYQGLGFLAWDPDQQAAPPGLADGDVLEDRLMRIVLGVGARGCGFEAPLEAMYRFLIDPIPYEDIDVFDFQTVPQGFDFTLLDMRESFLRPDSAVLIVVVSDEDDCSIRPNGDALLVGSSNTMWRGRAVCAENPDDPCCASCQDAPPPGCPDDPTCGLLTTAEDPLNLRCFDQKRRFGVDYLHPVARYVEGLTERQIVDRTGEVQPNPLFAGSRSPSMVTLGFITGVPWQDISISPESPGAGFLAATDIPWGRVLGEGGTPPEDPLMVPSRAPRAGTHPVTGEAVAPPGGGHLENAINGHEHDLPDELQFACIYELEEPVACVDASCECAVVGSLNPVCQQENGNYATTQRFGRATPATRQLALARELDTISAVASICAAPVFAEENPAFAYKPAVDAMMRTLRRSLIKD